MMYIDNEVLEKMIMTIVEGFDRIEKKLDRMGRVKEFLNGDELLDNYDIARLLNVSLSWALFPVMGMPLSDGYTVTGRGKLFPDGRRPPGNMGSGWCRPPPMLQERTLRISRWS